MTNLDQFESVFKAADKTPFAYDEVEIRKVLVLTSLSEEDSQAVRAAADQLLAPLQSHAELAWELINGDQYRDVDQMLELHERIGPDLVCTYRNLHSPAPDHPYSLGSYVDVLTQATRTPVILLPAPAQLSSREQPLSGCKSVMAITDHLTGDNHLVNFAVRFAADEGSLFLTHVEDEHVFERYIETIGKIPAIDTDTARESLAVQLLKEPHDYIRSAKQILHEHAPHLSVEEIVTFGHHLRDYRRLIREHAVDLLVMNTKDEDQLAMHGVAYPLAVEMRDTPLLLL